MPENWFCLICPWLRLSAWWLQLLCRCRKLCAFDCVNHPLSPIVAAVGGGCLILTWCWQLRLDISSVAALTVSAICWLDQSSLRVWAGTASSGTRAGAAARGGPCEVLLEAHQSIPIPASTAAPVDCGTFLAALSECLFRRPALSHKQDFLFSLFRNATRFDQNLHSEPIFSQLTKILRIQRLLSLPKRRFSRFKIHTSAILYWRIVKQHNYCTAIEHGETLHCNWTWRNIVWASWASVVSLRYLSAVEKWALSASSAVTGPKTAVLGFCAIALQFIRWLMSTIIQCTLRYFD